MPVNCDRARRALSERMDGEHLSRRAAAALAAHLATCAACRAFEAQAWALREHVRLGLAPAVPDLVEPIMAAVRTEARTRPRDLRVVAPQEPAQAPPVPAAPHRPPLLRRLAPQLAAALVGVLVGSLAVGGPWSPERPATAVDVTTGVLRTAAHVTAYRASFRILERNLSPEVPLRELSMELWFRAPERFRLDVTDHTVYPSDEVAPTDLRLVTDGQAWYLRSPPPCPTCPPRESLVTNRTPFSSETPVPADLVVPIATLSSADGVRVLSRDLVSGRWEVTLAMPFERAAPLFPFLELGGAWRPFYPHDRVQLTLDEETWAPLAWSVYPARGRERDQWALRFGLPEEPPGLPIMEVRRIAVSPRPPAEAEFAVPAHVPASDAGAVAVGLADVARETGFRPVAPERLDGLRLYRVVVPEPALGQGPSAILAYAEGLRWLKVAESRSPAAAGSLLRVDPHAEELALAGGIAYYEPATPDHGRRLAIHTAEGDLYLETNLPREDLLAVASSLPVRGLPLPRSWRLRATELGTVERVGLGEAEAVAPFELLWPRSLPEGTALTSVELVRADGRIGVTLYFQGREVALGDPLRLHLEPGEELPPTSEPEVLTVELADVTARYTPGSARLEWISEGRYVSLEGPGLTLPQLAKIAASLAPLEPAPGLAPTGPATPATPVPSPETP